MKIVGHFDFGASEIASRQSSKVVLYDHIFIQPNGRIVMWGPSARLAMYTCNDQWILFERKRNQKINNKKIEEKKKTIHAAGIVSWKISRPALYPLCRYPLSTRVIHEHGTLVTIWRDWIGKATLKQGLYIASTDIDRRSSRIYLLHWFWNLLEYPKVYELPNVHNQWSIISFFFPLNQWQKAASELSWASVYKNLFPQYLHANHQAPNHGNSKKYRTVDL